MNREDKKEMIIDDKERITIADIFFLSLLAVAYLIGWYAGMF